MLNPSRQKVRCRIAVCSSGPIGAGYECPDLAGASMVYTHEQEPPDRESAGSRLRRYRACGRFRGTQMNAMSSRSLVAVPLCVIDLVSDIIRLRTGNRESAHMPTLTRHRRSRTHELWIECDTELSFALSQYALYTALYTSPVNSIDKLRLAARHSSVHCGE